MLNTWLPNCIADPNTVQLLPYMGVAPEGTGGSYEQQNHLFYLWIPHILLLSSLLFYLPHIWWKWCEGQAIQMVTSGLRTRQLQDLLDHHTVLQPLVQHTISKWNSHSGYFWKYFIHELAHLAVVIGHLHVLNVATSEIVTEYGPKFLLTVMNDNPMNRKDPLFQLFPPFVKCTFFNHGPSGSVQKEDAMCLLNMNSTYERCFMMLWLWLFALAVVSIFHIVYLLVVATVPSIRFITRDNRISGPKDQLVQIEISGHRFEKNTTWVIGFSWN